MAKAQARDEVIACPYLGVGEATEVLLAAATTEYRTVSASATRMQFARTYRPVWSLALGFLLLPIVIGIPFLLIKSTETWAAFVEEDHRRVQVRVTGSIMSSVVLTLREELASAPAPVAPSTSGSYAFEVVDVPSAGGTPMPRYTNGEEQSDPPSFAPVSDLNSQAGSPVDGMTVPLHSTMDGVPGASANVVGPQPSGSVWKPPDLGVIQPVAPAANGRSGASPKGEAGPSQHDETVLRRSANGAGRSIADVDDVTTLAILVARFDTGERVPLRGSIFVGRDPESRDADDKSTFIPIVDSDRSVSKTHLVLRSNEGVTTVEDLGSTNGTLVTEPNGSELRVEPGTAIAVPEGAIVTFGDRTFRVVREPIRETAG